MSNCITGLEGSLAVATQCRDDLADFVTTSEHNDMPFYDRLLVKKQRVLMQALVGVLEKRLECMQ